MLLQHGARFFRLYLARIFGFPWLHAWNLLIFRRLYTSYGCGAAEK
jgi:hypothetical protein